MDDIEFDFANTLTEQGKLVALVAGRLDAKIKEYESSEISDDDAASGKKYNEIIRLVEEFDRTVQKLKDCCQYKPDWRL